MEKQQYYLLKGLNKAVRDYEMVVPGDRIAVAVSGGKDSLTLLQLLSARRAWVKEKYTLLALHVVGDPQLCGSVPDPAPMLAYLNERQVDYEILALEHPSGSAQRENQSPCFHCAWRRRKSLFQAASRLGCTKVAFGHHSDDIAQTTLLNLFFQGRIETMEPKAPLFGGEIEIIRPLAYIREKEIARFARAAELPVVAQPCTAAESSRRNLMNDIIAQVERVYPKVRINLARAGLLGRAHRNEPGG